MNMYNHEDWTGCLVAVALLLVTGLLMSMCGLLDGEPEDLDPYHHLDAPEMPADSTEALWRT